jgi:flagellar motility protein MotE (MotC chaperone)
MDPDNAAEIYSEVAERVQTSAKVTEWAEAFAKMDAENAAAILEEMTGDTDLVAKILMSMTSKQRAAILAEMDTVFAAKMTKIMYPN